MKTKDPYEVAFKKFDQTFGWLGSFWERWAEGNFPEQGGISDHLKAWIREHFAPKKDEEKAL